MAEDGGRAVEEGLDTRERIETKLNNARTRPRSYDDFYRGEFPAMVALAYALSGSRWGAEDIAQDAFIAAHRDWARVGTLESPEGWIRRVVANKSVSVIRKRVAEAKALARLGGRPQAISELDSSDEEFWQAVRSLPRMQAKIVALRYLEDRTLTEIAATLAIAEGTVKTHLFRARAKLAKALGEVEDGGGGA